MGLYGYYWLERRSVQSRYLGAIEQPIISSEVFRPGAVESFIGKIEIPRLGVSAAVLEGVDDRTLRNAVGHVPGSAVPGKSGRVTLAGHRDTFFRGLKHVRISDRIRVTAQRVEYEYKVTSTQVVSPERVDVIAATSEPRLTLVTCYPFSYIGRAPLRFIVHAEPVPPESKSAPLAPQQPVVQHAVRRAKSPVSRNVPPVPAKVLEPEPQPEPRAMAPEPEGRRKVVRALTVPFRKAFGWVR